MNDEATINVRMPSALKRHGSQVLERNRVTPSQAVRGLYAYMEREQEIPNCLGLGRDGGDTVFDKRRKLARSVAGRFTAHETDVEAERRDRIEGKYGSLL